MKPVAGPTILTNSGEYFHFEKLNERSITIENIARGLSNTCRFGGQCDDFYSVAEHSVIISYMVPEKLAFQGLMHDAAEAFVGDMPKPLKEILPEYSVIEKRVERWVFDKFGIDTIDPLIKKADLELLATEKRQIMGNHDDWSWLQGVEAPAFSIKPKPPKHAYLVFMHRFHELYHKKRP